MQQQTNRTIVSTTNKH